MNYYPFHIGDYLSATRHLSWAEDAAYRRLLDTYYTTEKRLPLDLRAVCRLVLATTDEQREAVRVVLDEFFEQTPEGWKNSRADTEIDAMRGKQQKQRDKANKRWHKQVTEPGNASAMPQHEVNDAAASKTDADAMPPTPTPTPTPVLIEPNGSVGKADALPRCETQSVVDLYHDTLPELPAVRVMSDARQKAVRSFWKFVLTSKKSDGTKRAETAEQALAWIGGYFDRARHNDFLMGRGSKAPGHEGWQCDFDFLLSEKGKKHVLEKTQVHA